MNSTATIQPTARELLINNEKILRSLIDDYQIDKYASVVNLRRCEGCPRWMITEKEDDTRMCEKCEEQCTKCEECDNIIDKRKRCECCSQELKPHNKKKIKNE